MQRSDSLIKVVAVLVFAAVAVYIAFSFFGRKDTLLTVEAVSQEMRESAATVGYLVRQESPIIARGEGIAVSTPDGSKVAAGETVAVRYNGARAMERAARIQELQLRIQQLTALKNGETQDKLANDSILSLSACLTSGDLSTLYSISQNIEAYIISGEDLTSGDEEAEIVSLQEELAALTRAAQSDTEYIRTREPGVFSQVIDGLEHIASDDLDDIRPSDLGRLFSAISIPNNTVGKLVTDIRWYYVTTMREHDAAKLNVGGAANIEFSKSYRANLSMKVESVSPVENGRCAVVFSCDRFLQDVVSLRSMTGEVVFGRQSGIRVPRAGAHVDEEGQTYVYILEGLRAKKVLVKILQEEGEFYIVAREAGGLRVRDQIIVRAENLYDGAVVAG